jgi:glycosyltransferase involved in cell wall biosynthesis
VHLLAALVRLTDAELWLAGEGPLEPELRGLVANLGLGSRVRFLRHRSLMGSLYKSADLVLLTSAAEGTPLCLLEAMSAGVPVAATDVGGVRDIVGETGVLLDPALHPEAWAKELAALLEDEESMQRRAIAGRVRTVERHSPEGLVQQVEALYREVLSSGGK